MGWGGVATEGNVKGKGKGELEGEGEERDHGEVYRDAGGEFAEGHEESVEEAAPDKWAEEHLGYGDGETD